MTIESTLKERGDRYGDFADHAKIAQALQDIARDAEGWVRLDAAQRQALTVICDKIARILSGDPTYADNWHDIQGYAKLVEDRLPKDEKVNGHLNLPVVDLGPETERIIQEQRRHMPSAPASAAGGPQPAPAWSSGGAPVVRTVPVNWRGCDDWLGCHELPYSYANPFGKRS